LSFRNVQAAIQQARQLTRTLLDLGAGLDKGPVTIGASVTQTVSKAILAGFFPNICYLSAKAQKGPVFYVPSYELSAEPHPSSSFHQEETATWALFAKYLAISNRSYLFHLARFDEAWLNDASLVSAEFYRELRINDVRSRKICRQRLVPITWSDSLFAEFTSRRGRHLLEQEVFTFHSLLYTLNLVRVSYLW